MLCWYSIFLTQPLSPSHWQAPPTLSPFLMSLIESAPLREWGTRYDSLSTSPSPSITSSLSRIPPATACPSTANPSLLTPVAVTPAQIHTQGDKISHES